MLPQWAPQQAAARASVPICVSDFANGVYTLYGESVTVDALWQYQDGWFPYDTSMIIAGQGLQYSTTSGALSGRGPCGTPALAQYLIQGFIAVAEYTTVSPAGTYAGFLLGLEQFQTFDDSWFFHDNWNAPLDLGTMDAGQRQGNAYPYLTPTTPSVAGAKKLAVQIGPGPMGFSLNGAPVVEAVGTPFPDIFDTLTVTVNVQSDGTNTASSTLAKLTFYPQTWDISRLSKFSA